MSCNSRVVVCFLLTAFSFRSFGARIKVFQPQFPYREVPIQSCALSNQWLVVGYEDGEAMNKSGTIVHATIPSWNGLLIATKTYIPRGKSVTCVVSYRVVCEGSSVYLDLKDTCDNRTTKRKFFTSSRRTELHKSGLSNYFNGYDVSINVVLAGGNELQMFADGAEVTFTMVDPDESTRKLYGAAEFRYFIDSPRLQACQPMAENAVEFVSESTGHAYNTRLCSACRVFFEGALQNTTQVSPTPDEACSLGKTIRSRLACEKIGRDFVKETPSLLKKVYDSWEAQGQQQSQLIDANLASSMTCQDIGCCPLDTDMATSFNNIIAKQAAIEQGLEHAEGLELVTKILEDPASRQRLELNLKAKLFHIDSDLFEEFQDSDKVTERLPTTDAECKWDYKAASCANPEVCSYQYKFLDISFSESCRLKVRPSRPLSDSDCTFDWKKVKCAEPKFCYRSCRVGESLNQCCKLKKISPPAKNVDVEDVGNGSSTDVDASSSTEVDASSSTVVDVEDTAEVLEPEGSCVNPKDKRILASSALPDQLEAIGKSCFKYLSFTIDEQKSFKQHVKLGLSETCAVCFVDTSVCGLKYCFPSLSTKGKSHPDSQKCLKAKCEPDLAACSGLLPNERNR